MTRLAFLLMAGCFAGRDNGPTTTNGHITVIRRGILTYNGVPYPPLTIENNSKEDAQVIYQGVRFAAPSFATTMFE